MRRAWSLSTSELLFMMTSYNFIERFAYWSISIFKSSADACLIFCSIGLGAGIAVSAGDPLAGRVRPVALGLGRHNATTCVAVASADAVRHVAVASVALTAFRAAGQAWAVLGVADAVGGTRGEVTVLFEEAGGSSVF